MNPLLIFVQFVKHLLGSRALIGRLSKNEFQKSYRGSYLGLVWAVMQPLSFVLVMWFVFSFGFRVGPVAGDVPFILWLLSGMVPWFFFSEAVSSGTNSVISNSYLVKKVAFRVSILPLVQIGAAVMVHGMLLVILLAFFIGYARFPTLHWLQFPYYLLCTIVLVLGISWLTSAVRVFVADVGSAIAILLQLGFWFTPIFWQVGMIPEQYQYILKLNPVFYVVNGYRDTFIHEVWFWERGWWTVYFLVMTAVLMVVGALVFRRLRPHFADVL
jgi:ABC-type polysaccharide/polyol phosphate export permease